MRRRLIALVIALGLLSACTGGPTTCDPPMMGDGCEVVSGPVIENGDCFYEIGCT